MTDRHLLYLDAAQLWDLAFDSQQWMIRRRRSPRRASGGRVEGDHSAVYTWEPRWYVGGEKRVLFDYIEGKRPPLPEKDRPRIRLTPAAVLALSELPDRFQTWRDQSPVADAAE